MNADDNLMMEAMLAKIPHRFDRLDEAIEKISRRRECFEGDTLLDNFDLCKLLNITERTLARYRQKKLIRYYMIDRKVYYKASVVQEFLKKAGKY